MEEEQLLKWNKIIEKTPPLPFVVNTLLNELDNPDVDIKKIEEIIEKDTLLVTKVLRMANSAYYGFPRSIATVKEAIIVLGFNTIRSIVLAISIKSVMNVDVSGYWMGSMKGLWEHSLLTAGGARVIAKKLKLQDPERYFVAGLLHDIGKIILSSIAKEYKVQFLKNFLFYNKTISQSEEEIIGISHNMVGYLLANYWNLPQFIAEVILYHDDPSKAPEIIRKDITVVSAANELSYNFIPENLIEIGVSDKKNKKAEEYLSYLSILNERDSILGAMKKFIQVSVGGYDEQY
ncbi:MAG: HDOD domain-containing protein [Spirochaetia bacterium]|nr:HDOD domain-containing protein [Spirochaetota bacterium]MCX8096423.1 HDOD domain-containing protein [Spirochaetota bacterium]MDW8112773.1 HDOD domain-containing protein [Spirochaetia bacterium]